MHSAPPLDSIAGTLIKTTLADFPERVSCAAFLAGCNLRCPYCYNTALVHADFCTPNVPFVTFRTLCNHLEKRNNVLTGFVISGGEPLLHPEQVAFLIDFAKNLGYHIKLDTNGTFPQEMAQFCAQKSLCPDYIAMDIKTSPARYAELSPHKQQALAESVTQSIAFLRTLPAHTREWRTVLVPPLVTKKEIQEIARLLPQDARWIFAPFQNTHCLSKDYTFIEPYSHTEAMELVDFAKQFIPGAQLRG